MIKTLHKLILIVALLFAGPVHGSLLLLGAGGAGAGGGGGGGTCSQSNAFFARAPGISGADITNYDNLICGMVTDGTFAKMDVLYIFAAPDSTTALLNLVSSSYNGVAFGSPPFTAYRGFTGTQASTTIYIDSQFNPVTAVSPKYIVDNAHLSGWNITLANTNSLLGSGDTTGLTKQSQIYARLIADNNAYFRLNSLNVGGVAVADARGHYIDTRMPAGTNHLGFKNGVQIQSVGDAGDAMYNGNIYILAVNLGGTPSGGAPQLAEASIGSNLNGGSDALNFYNRLRTYMTAVGVP